MQAVGTLEGKRTLVNLTIFLYGLQNRASSIQKQLEFSGKTIFIISDAELDFQGYLE